MLQKDQNKLLYFHWSAVLYILNSLQSDEVKVWNLALSTAIVTFWILVTLSESCGCFLNYITRIILTPKLVDVCTEPSK